MVNIPYLIIHTLKRYSSKERTPKTGPMSREEIVRQMKEDYPDLHVTSKIVRTGLEMLVTEEMHLPDEKKTIGYRVYRVKNQERKTDYYYNNAISDVELKFLIDSVLHSKIFRSETAQDFARRIQRLSGKNLLDLTPYANESFGEQRFTLETDVLKNMEMLLLAKRRGCFVAIDWNVYDVQKEKAALVKLDRRILKPIEVILNDGRYFCFARHPQSEEIYTYSVDLMQNIELLEVDEGKRKPEGQEDFRRSSYILTHPYMMGGERHRYKLRVMSEYFSRLVDDFSYEISIISGTVTEETVDVRVTASRMGMRYWLLRHYEVAELIDNMDYVLEEELADAVQILYQRYHRGNLKKNNEKQGD